MRENSQSKLSGFIQIKNDCYLLKSNKNVLYCKDFTIQYAVVGHLARF